MIPRKTRFPDGLARHLSGLHDGCMATKSTGDSPDIFARLNDARKRHALVLALAPLSAEKMVSELALLRALVEVQSPLIAELVDRNSHGDVMFDLMVCVVKQLDPHIRRGQKVLVSAKKGHAAVHGTDAEKSRKAERMLEVCTRIAKAHPKWGVTTIVEEASNELGCASRTIRRNLPGLKSILQRN